MKIGIGLPNPVPGVTGKTLIAWAGRAEERGFSSLATIDRVAFPTYESLVSLAAAAAATERIGLVTNILLAPTRSAVLLAKESASLDQLSGGRFTLGLGVGARKDDFEAAEREFVKRGRQFDEALETMHAAWQGRPVIDGCAEPVTPTPTNGKSVPILFGGSTEKAIERTVRWGVGWTASGGGSAAVGAFAQRVRAAWKAAGREGSPRIVALAYFGLGEGSEDVSKRYILRYYGNLGERAKGFAESVPRTPQAVRDTAKFFEDAGVDELMLDPTVADVREVDLLADAVL